MKTRTPLIGTVLLVALSGAARAQDATDATTFASMAASANALEILSSQMAIGMLPAGDTRTFAEQMVADHTKAAQNLTVAAQADGVAVPTDMLPPHASEYERLKAANPQTFEAAYITLQVAAHDEAVALFETYASSGQDGNLKDFAAATLPTLEQHQEHIQAIAEK